MDWVFVATRMQGQFQLKLDGTEFSTGTAQNWSASWRAHSSMTAVPFGKPPVVLVVAIGLSVPVFPNGSIQNASCPKAAFLNSSFQLLPPFQPSVSTSSPTTGQGRVILVESFRSASIFCWEELYVGNDHWKTIRFFFFLGFSCFKWTLDSPILISIFHLFLFSFCCFLIPFSFKSYWTQSVHLLHGVPFLLLRSVSIVNTLFPIYLSPLLGSSGKQSESSGKQSASSGNCSLLRNVFSCLFTFRYQNWGSFQFSIFIIFPAPKTNWCRWQICGVLWAGSEAVIYWRPGYNFKYVSGVRRYCRVLPGRWNGIAIPETNRFVNKLFFRIVFI